MSPFEKLYSKLCCLIFDDPEFETIAQPGNVVRFDNPENRDPLKKNPVTADFPEFMLLPNGGPLNLTNTSSSTKANLRYQLVVNTGDMRVNNYVHPICWYVLCRAAKWKTEVTSLQWCGNHFVTVLRIENAAIGQTLEERPKGIRGYAAVWQFDIECNFKTSDLVFKETT